MCVRIYIYIFFFICPHVHSLENTLRTSSSLTPAGKFPINTWWLSGALRAVSLASLVFIPPRASLDERAGAGWGLGGGCKTGWERGWKKKKRNNKLTWCSRYFHAWKYLSTIQANDLTLKHVLCIPQHVLPIDFILRFRDTAAIKLDVQTLTNFSSQCGLSFFSPILLFLNVIYLSIY